MASQGFGGVTPLSQSLRNHRRGEVHAFATAAAREAINGPEFLAAATQAIGRPIELISGAREAHLSALGVISGVLGPTASSAISAAARSSWSTSREARRSAAFRCRLATLALMDVRENRRKSRQDRPFGAG